MPKDSLFFFLNDPAPTEIYPLSLHDALPIYIPFRPPGVFRTRPAPAPATLARPCLAVPPRFLARSEEHTSELQSQSNLVCRLLLEKKKICQARLRGIPTYPSRRARPLDEPLA